MPDQEPPRRLAFLLVEGFNLATYAQAAEAFALANRLHPQRGFALQVLGLSARPVRASCGARVAVRHLAGESLRYDLLAICAGDAATRMADPALLDWLRRCARFGTTLAGLDVGVWPLARAGVLNGARPTVAPRLAPAYEEAFGVAPVAAFGHAPSEGATVRSAAGPAGALELALDLIAGWEGEAMAESVAQELGHDRQAQAATAQPLSRRLGLHHAALARCVDAMEANMEAPLDKARLTEIAGVSARQLERLFLRVLGETPGTFYRNLRLARARQLLEHTGMPVTEIAMATGFVSASHFGRSFHAVYGQTPGELRRARQHGHAPRMLSHLG
jgi:transcriptional regulator GlxA family with amidase domain